MKIEHLAVIFVLIILPIDIVLGLYLDAQMNTIRNQAMYDSKLVDCVYDAMKVYQSNSIVDTENNIVTTKMENIEASANTFLSSLQTSFGLSGYKASVMQEYVPAVVYTMYDGYYIYSKFNNTLSQKQIKNFDNTFKDGKMYEGIKSYVFYSCRYQRNKDKTNEDDFVITYSLDNYITIQGKVKGKYECASGYLIDGITKDGDDYVYDEVTYSKDGRFEGNFISRSSEYIIDPYLSNVKGYEYTKINGTKYYVNTDEEEIFNFVNGTKVVQAKKSTDNDLYKQYKSAIQSNKDAYLYYKEAYEFTKKVRETFKLSNLKASDAVYSEGGTIKHISEFGNYTIFGSDKTSSGKYIQDSDSQFNQHRKAVIRYTIETNLKAAIAGFGGISTQDIDYIMPKISEEDWETVENNVSVIGFLQGLDIGTKKYNGYAVVSNTLTSEYVDENSIYLINNDDNQYYRANATDITNVKVGAYNLDFEKHYIKIGDNNLYYYPQGYKIGSTVYPYTGSYTSIVAQTSVDTEYEDMYKYMRDGLKKNSKLNDSQREKIKRAYYTALAKERYGSYKISHDTQFDYYLKNYRQNS